MRCDAIGTKQTYRGACYFVRFWGEADMHDHVATTASVANQAQRSKNLNMATRSAASFWRRWQWLGILRDVNNRQHPLEEDAA
jgi:hypothetical protein